MMEEDWKGKYCMSEGGYHYLRRRSLETTDMIQGGYGWQNSFVMEELDGFTDGNFLKVIRNYYFLNSTVVEKRYSNGSSCMVKHILVFRIKQDFPHVAHECNPSRRTYVA